MVSEVRFVAPPPRRQENSRRYRRGDLVLDSEYVFYRSIVSFSPDVIPGFRFD